jgi:hypothetical protein
MLQLSSIGFILKTAEMCEQFFAMQDMPTRTTRSRRQVSTLDFLVLILHDLLLIPWSLLSVNHAKHCVYSRVPCTVCPKTVVTSCAMLIVWLPHLVLLRFYLALSDALFLQTHLY